MKYVGVANWNRNLLWAGLFLMLLGAAHVPLQLLFPRDWESLIGWRKPILFGLSTGVTLISLAWAAGAVRGKFVSAAAKMIAVLAVAEVLIITVQTWRGVPAHFNNGAALDQLLSNSIDLMLIFITLGIFYLTVLAFKKTNYPADYLLTLRLGMTLLSLACLLGFAVAIYGNLTLSAGGNPELVNPRGVPKFVHGMPIHALQILPVWLFSISLFNQNINSRKISVYFAALTICVTTVYAFWQTFNGLGRFELNFGGAALIILTFVCGVGAVYFAFPRRLG